MRMRQERVRILDRLLAIVLRILHFSSHMILDCWVFSREICQDCYEVLPDVDYDDDGDERLEHASTGYGLPLTTDPTDFVAGWLTRRPSAKMEGES